MTTSDAGPIRVVRLIAGAPIFVVLGGIAALLFYVDIRAGADDRRRGIARLLTGGALIIEVLSAVKRFPAGNSEAYAG